MVARSEPLLIPFFFALCVHLSLFILLGYWSDWQPEEKDPSLGPALKVALAILPVAPILAPSPAKPIQPQPPPPAPPPKEENKPEKEGIPEAPEVVNEKTLDKLIEELRDLELKEEKREEEQKKEENEEKQKRETEAPAQEAVVTDKEKKADTQQQLRSQALAYYQRNKLLVERNFNPGTAAQRNQYQGLVARLKIFLDEQGQLMDVEIIASSGNRVFDVEAERAVRRVNKFIIPEDSRLQELYFRQVIMEFTLSR